MKHLVLLLYFISVINYIFRKLTSYHHHYYIMYYVYFIMLPGLENFVCILLISSVTFTCTAGSVNDLFPLTSFRPF